MRSFISSFKPLLAAALLILGIEGTIAVTRRPSFVERTDYLTLSFGHSENGADYVIYQKLNRLPLTSADIVQVGDSSGFHGVKPDVVMRYLGGLQYVNLSCCAGTGYDGYYALARTALRHMRHPKALVLYVSMNNLPRPDLNSDRTRVHDSFGRLRFLFNTPSEILRPSVTDWVYTLDGKMSPRQGGLSVLNTGYYPLIARTKGWMPAPEPTMDGSKRPAYFDAMCSTGPPYADPAEPFTAEPFKRFAALAHGYRARLILIFNPHPCPTWNQEMLATMHRIFSQLKREYPDFAVYPQTLFDHWPNYMFVGPDHLRVGYERPNSVRVGRFVADAFGIPTPSGEPQADETPPPIIDLRSAPAWSDSQIGDAWQATGSEVQPQGAEQGARIVETDEGPGLHYIETVATGLTPGPYIVSVRFKAIGDRIIELAARGRARHSKGSTVCKPKLKTAYRTGDFFDGDMSYLSDDWMLCWGSIEVSGKAMGIDVNILPSSGGPAYIGDGRSGLVIDEVEVHPGWRPATAETGPPGGENAMN